MMERRAALEPSEATNLQRLHFASEETVFTSVETFAPLDASARDGVRQFLSGLRATVTEPRSEPGHLGSREPVFQRMPAPRGPMAVFGYDYLEAHIGAEKAAALKLPTYSGLRGGGGEYAYEVLNLVDGRRTAREIRDVVSAIYGPVPLEMVREYLGALQSAGVIGLKSP